MTRESILICEGLSPNSQEQIHPSAFTQLQALLNESAFWAKDRKLEDLETAIAFSCPVFSVWDEETLIGFARATSDGVYRAGIWDVVIHPNYRGLGLGQTLIETLLAHPRMRHVERVYLTTTYQQAFYQKMGFETNATTTMVRCAKDNEPTPPELMQDLVSQLKL